MRERFHSFFFDVRGSRWTYVLRMGAVSLLPSAAIVLALDALNLIDPETAPSFEGGMSSFVAVVILGPLIETALLAVLLSALSLGIKPRFLLAIMSALVWATLHSLVSPIWGIVIFWPFFVFSCAYLAWREVSWLKAVSVAWYIHMLQNLLPGVMILSSASSLAHTAHL